jgi:hypothetical protein
MAFTSAAQFESLCGRAVGLEKMVMRAAKSKNHVLLIRPAAEARPYERARARRRWNYQKSENYYDFKERNS